MSISTSFVAACYVLSLFSYTSVDVSMPSYEQRIYYCVNYVFTFIYLSRNLHVGNISEENKHGVLCKLSGASNSHGHTYAYNK